MSLGIIYLWQHWSLEITKFCKETIYSASLT